jgi:pimeloyl-ACP methyl ester carboxylesterase
MRGVWAKVRRVWAICGTIAFIVFTTWALLAYRATATAHAALQGTSDVAVTRGEGYRIFEPTSSARDTGLVFFAGALVDPAAYAPLMVEVARAGCPAVLVELPRRGAFGGADGSDVLVRARDGMRAAGAVRRWVIGGHSKGGAVAAQFVRKSRNDVAGLVLIGTSHPRDFSLAHITIPVVQVYGTRDTVADVEKLEANRANLPADTRRVRIDGGNHSQFGYYGFQPGDWPATITREAQQRLTRDAVIAALREVAAVPETGAGR